MLKVHPQTRSHFNLFFCLMIFFLPAFGVRAQQLTPAATNATAASEKKSTTHAKALKNHLVFITWPGPQKFIQSAKDKKIEPCSFIEAAEKELSNREYSVRRIMLISAEAKCASRAALAKKYLKSKDPVVQEAAIRLTMKLDKPEREKLHKDVMHLRHNSKDAHVLRAVSDYLDMEFAN